MEDASAGNDYITAHLLQPTDDETMRSSTGHTGSVGGIDDTQLVQRGRLAN